MHVSLVTTKSRGASDPSGYEVIGLCELPDVSAEFRSSAGEASTFSG